MLQKKPYIAIIKSYKNILVHILAMKSHELSLKEFSKDPQKFMRMFLYESFKNPFLSISSLANNEYEEQLIDEVNKYMHEHVFKNSGFVYVVQNNINESLFKIGFTTNSPSTRLSQLNGAANLSDLKLTLVRSFPDARLAEKIIHEDLDKFRFKKEYFSCELTLIKTSLRSIAWQFERIFERNAYLNWVEYSNPSNRNELIKNIENFGETIG